MYCTLHTPVLPFTPVLYKTGVNLYLYCTLTIRLVVYKGMHKQTMFHSIFHSRGGKPEPRGGECSPCPPLKETLSVIFAFIPCGMVDCTSQIWSVSNLCCLFLVAWLTVPAKYGVSVIFAVYSSWYG